VKTLLHLIGKIWKKLPRGARARMTRTLQPKFTVSAGGIITNEEGKVLLLNHLLRPSSGWGIPGGFLNSHEQAEAALKRELMEEAAVELHNIKVHRVRTFGRHIEIDFIATGVGEGKVSSREILDLGWFEIDEMPEEMSVDQHFLIRNALGRPAERE
jgi:ADP-ribose pyrophosphatase YjhB (NUDIX family)